MFYMGKVFKIAFWSTTGLFVYHLLLVLYSKDPEKKTLVNAWFLELAKYTQF